MHELSWSTICGIFLNQGLNPYLLHCQGDSLPLSHQGSPFLYFWCFGIWALVTLEGLPLKDRDSKGLPCKPAFGIETNQSELTPQPSLVSNSHPPNQYSPFPKSSQVLDNWAPTCSPELAAVIKTIQFWPVQQEMPGKPDNHMQKKRTWILSYTIHKNWLNDTEKLLEENTGKKSLDIGLDNEFFGTTQKALTTKAKLNKWDCIKLKGFWTAKETIFKNERAT